MLGDTASFPSTEEQVHELGAGWSGVHERMWTAAKQTATGDLLLFYFMAPRKEVCFVARAASPAFFDPEAHVMANRTVRDEQWWCFTTPLIAIQPIKLSDLRGAAPGLNLRGRSGRYLRPDTIDQLNFLAADARLQEEIEDVVVRPHGSPDLPPDPAQVTLARMRAIASGALKLEAHVEQHIVEPLVRLAIGDLEHHGLVRQYRIGRRSADYVVIDRDDHVTCVIEAKLVIRKNALIPWSDCSDFQQLSWYTTHVQANGILVDAHRLHLVRRAEGAPFTTLERASLTSEDLRVLRAHLLGQPQG